MKRLFKVAIASLLLISMLLTSIGCSALAEEVTAIYGKSYIRTRPSLSGGVIATLQNGESGTYLGSAVDERGVTWYKIRYNGKIGWVSSKYTSYDGSQPGIYTDGSVYSTRDTYIYNRPEGSVVGELPAGERSNYLGEETMDSAGGLWFYITYGTITGWVSDASAYRSGGSDEDNIVDDPSEGNGGEVYEDGYVIAIDGRTFIRSAPSTDANDVGTLPQGEIAAYLGKTSVDKNDREWYKIRYNGITGWVSARYCMLEQ